MPRSAVQSCSADRPHGAAARRSADQLGQPILLTNVISVATPGERVKFIARLKASRKRVGVFCLEDNIALLLWRGLVEAKIDCPGRVGLLSGMGTAIVTDEGLSSLKIDYERLGAVAGELLVEHEQRVVKLPTQLALGKTT